MQRLGRCCVQRKYMDPMRSDSIRSLGSAAGRRRRGLALAELASYLVNSIDKLASQPGFWWIRANLWRNVFLWYGMIDTRQWQWQWQWTLNLNRFIKKKLWTWTSYRSIADLDWFFEFTSSVSGSGGLGSRKPEAGYVRRCQKELVMTREFLSFFIIYTYMHSLIDI